MIKNKKIQLCGIGNGLLDLQYEVSDGDILRLGLSKGEMRLVSTNEQSKIINAIDKKSFNKCSGGSAANTVIAFAEFGASAAYMTSLGNDDNGKFYAQEFKELGINLHSEFLDEKTGTCLVLITPDSERTMNTCLGASELYSEDFLDEQLIAESEWLYLEGYKLTADISSKALFKAIELAKKHNTKIAFTFSDVFVVNIFNGALTRVVQSSDLIFCNENEALSFTKESNSDDAFKNLYAKVPNVVMTLGSKGARVFWNGIEYSISSYPANPVDSTGAGDMFAGAFMYGIINTGNPVFAGQLASLSAAKIVSQMGARLKADFQQMKIDVRDAISLKK